MSIDKMDMFDGISDDWIELLDNGLDGVILNINNDNLINDGVIVPAVEDIFAFARLTTLSDIKIIIIGQDPYPNKNANGLAFSCNNIIPGSLKNIYKCLIKSKLMKGMPKHGNLSKWAEQGVLLLNCSLTTVEGKSNAHSSYWDTYIDKLIINIMKSLRNTREIIFMLWGNAAKNKVYILEDSDIPCMYMEQSHPSPAASKSFEDCRHFIDANTILGNPIDWDLYVADKPELKEANAAVAVAAAATKEVEREANVTEPRELMVFTDGSAYPTRACADARAGYGILFRDAFDEKESKNKSNISTKSQLSGTRVIAHLANDKHFATNQRAEGMAIYDSLKILRDNDEWTKCTIITDSQFWIDMITKYMPSWNKKGLDFESKKNSDITKKLFKLFSKLTTARPIELLHVRSHNKSGLRSSSVDSFDYFCYMNNNLVDRYANEGRKMSEAGKRIDKI